MIDQRFTYLFILCLPTVLSLLPLTTLLVHSVGIAAETTVETSKTEAVAEEKNEAAGTAVTAAQTSPRFDVYEYVIEGNSVLSNEAIERAVYPFLGPDRTVQDVNQARTALEKAYQDNGYLTVTIELPEQKVTAGEIRLLVVEGSVDKLRVSGAQYHLPSAIRGGVPSLAAGTVPQFGDVQQELADLGRQPDRRLTPLLRPGKAPGKVEVELKVEDTLPLHGSIEANNKQSANTVEGRVEASLRYDNLFQLAHSIGVNWIVAPENTDHANIVSFNYGLPFDRGDYAFAYATVSDSDVPSGLGGGTVVKGTSFGLRYRFALTSNGAAFAHGISIGTDYRDNKDDLTVSGLTVPRTLKYWGFAARYDHTRFDTGDGVTTSADANLSLGIRGLADRTVDCDGIPADQFACKRFNAQPNFLVLRTNVEHRRPVLTHWNLRARVEAQFANGPLVSQEQYGLGGFDTVRGYYEYEQFGDTGALLRLEMGSPVIASLDTLTVRALGFTERGQVWILDSLPGEDDSVPLGSYGLGLRAEGKSLSGRLEWGVPVFGTSRTQRRDGRGNISVKYQF